MSEKNYTIEFYAGSMNSDDRKVRLSDAFLGMEKAGCPVITMYGIQYEIRDLVSHGNGNSYTGILAKFREDDIPHAGTPGGKEHELDLDEGEGLIEKNYFSYHKKNNLLVYQRNRNGSGAGRLGEYISDFLNETVTFDPVLQLEPMRRLMKGEVIPRSLELSFARPTNPELYPKDDWSNTLLDLLNSSGGARMKVKITSDLRSNDKDRQSLRVGIKRSIRKILDMGDVRVARLQVNDDGVEHPIDLIADRIISEQSVKMNGRYPDPASMYKALREARIAKAQLIDEYFGSSESLN